MHLFYFSCDCCAIAGHASAMADVFVGSASRSQAETRLREHVEASGWRIREIQHFELVQGIPVHDARLGALIKTAKQTSIAAAFSPYGAQSNIDAAPENPIAPSNDGNGVVQTQTSQPESRAETLPRVEEQPPQKLVNPRLSGSLAADHAALQNDLLQAQELAADFQHQLAGKSNECALLKQIIEKTQADLANLQAGIVQLRAERHRLANEAMKAQALEVFRDSLQRKLEAQVIQLQERDRRIAELVIETVCLREALDEKRNAAVSPRPAILPVTNAATDEEIEITPETPRPVRFGR